MTTAKYKRVLLKLSGEAFRGNAEFGIDASVLATVAKQIKQIVEMGADYFPLKYIRLLGSLHLPLRQFLECRFLEESRPRHPTLWVSHVVPSFAFTVFTLFHVGAANGIA